MKLAIFLLLFLGFTLPTYAQIKIDKIKVDEDRPKGDEKPNKEETKTKPTEINVTDFDDLDVSKMDNRVVQYRRGSYLYTLTPFRDLWLTPERKEAFEASQIFAEQLVKHWLYKSFGLQYENLFSTMDPDLQKMTAEQIRETMRAQGDTKPGLPTASEILALSMDAEKTVQKLKDRSKFLVSFDQLVDEFDKNQDEIFELSNENSLTNFTTPTSFLFQLGFKAPNSILNAVRESRYKNAAFLLSGSITFVMIVRPWKMVKLNLDTGFSEETFYLESATQVWLMKDSKNALNTNWNGHWRAGTGLLFGDFNKVSEVWGVTAGRSQNFRVLKSNLAGQPLPLTWNLKVGTITAAAETLTGILSLENFIKHTYFMVSRQFGLQSQIINTGNWEAGMALNLHSISDKISIKPESIEQITKELNDVIPGAEISVNRDGEMRLRVPVKKPSETLENPSPSSNPDSAGTSQEISPPTHEKQ